MKPWNVVLTGATGFVGSAVLRRLAMTAGPGGRPVRIVAVSRRAVPEDQDGAVRRVSADVSDPAGVRGLLAGADALVHAVSYVGKDAELCRAVNIDGTMFLMREAADAGVERIVQVSTSAVYGPGPHRGVDVRDLRPAPSSVASASRLAAESFTLGAGGLVLRPNLIVGRGDAWVVPAIAELTRRVPPQWGHGTGLQSVVDVDDLARLVAASATGARPCQGVQHAAHPRAVSTAALREELSRHGLAAPADGAASWESCRTLLRRSTGRFGDRQLELLTLDHHYLSDRVWTLLGVDPGPGPLARLARSAAWYRRAAGVSAT
ncbi:hypothetical protein HY68_34620 [Streptomyces sp. AcH 505]|uniref:NAD-dependent epimerase/dehydratase family protein n=1 Tax=Streptomyces sp. AcH 505 TaxID=352211 RepID=UPI000591FDD0|nr:hypothetical protein HY68_34620 [Streptomyces sp. AcH 505]